jgi:hypothetical protein
VHARGPVAHAGAPSNQAPECLSMGLATVEQMFTESWLSESIVRKGRSRTCVTVAVHNREADE